MQTWTYWHRKNWTDEVAMVVSADHIDVAVSMVQERVDAAGLDAKVGRENLIPLPTHHRYVRVLVKPR